MRKRSEEYAREQTTTKFLDSLTEGRFLLYGQPIVPLRASRSTSRCFEVFIRYMEEEDKCLPPGGFFETLEECKLLSVLDRWVIGQVVRRLNAPGREMKNGAPSYSVNLSVDSLRDEAFGELLLEYRRKEQLPRNRLGFEITERDAVAHADAARRVGAALRQAGCILAISSYGGKALRPSLLRPLGVRVVKIDGGLANGVTRSAAKCATVKAIALICRKLGIRTIAETVEHRQVLEKLREIGVHCVQGYAIAEPAPLDQLIGKA